MIDWTIIASVTIAVLGVCGTWLTARIQHKGRPENALIDQLQESMDAERKDRTDSEAVMKKDLADLKVEQIRSKRRERIRDDYINALRRHIEAGMPPPPPPWPEGLYE